MAKNICATDPAIIVVHWDTMQETVIKLGNSTMRENSRTKEAIIR